MKIFSLILLSVSLTSCGVNKLIEKNKQSVLSQKNNLVLLITKADSLNFTRIAKLDKGELDENTDSVTLNYINHLKDSVNKILGNIDILLANKKALKKTNQINLLINGSQSVYNNSLENIFFYDDLFSAETFSRLNTATFFGPGEYTLSDSISGQASSITTPIISNALAFAKKYPTKNLKAMFIVLGYADEQDIAAGGELYQDLAKAITETKTPDRKLLNQELSKRRASSIKNILKKGYDLNVANKTSINFTPYFIATGKGETLPSGSIKNYAPVDERRRVVLLYWSILPQENKINQ